MYCNDCMTSGSDCHSCNGLKLPGEFAANLILRNPTSVRHFPNAISELHQATADILPILTQYCSLLMHPSGYPHLNCLNIAAIKLVSRKVIDFCCKGY